MISTNDPIIHITTAAGVVVKTTLMSTALSFWHDGACVEYEDGTLVFETNIKHFAIAPKKIYPIWLDENEKNWIVAHWEKTGVMGSIVQKIRASENLKGTK